MSWTAPMTAVANATFFAAEWNTYIRDNLNATEVGIADNASRLITVGDTANALEEKTITNSTARAAFTTSSTTFVQAPDGPTLSATVAFGGMLFITHTVLKPAYTGRSFMGWRVLDSVGAEIVAANALASVIWYPPPTAPTEPASVRFGGWFQLPTSVNGQITIEAMYQVTTSGATFTDRTLTFMAF